MKTLESNLLDVENLFVGYETDDENVKALNGVSFSMKRGETLGIVGETGAGKTTTALSLMQLLPEYTGKLYSGHMSYNDFSVESATENEMRAIRGGKISMIFQDPMTSLNPVLTIGDQIGEVLKFHTKLNIKEMEDKVEEMLELVGIPPQRKNEYPHQFSGGMKQRVVIAIALACDPELLIADEPTTALDVTIQAQVLDMMEELKKRLNTSMILITHDLGVVAQTCDNVAIMYAGEIIEYGSVYDIFESKSHHPYTTGLFGSIPKLADTSKRLNPIPGLMPNPADLPSGCKFHPRCPSCMEICKTDNPEDAILGTQRIKCHLLNKTSGGV